MYVVLEEITVKIIVLLGENSSGKTTTLNLVYKTISKNAPRSIIQYGSKDDFESMFLYNNQNVAIYSLGDIQYKVIDAIDKYTNRNIDVLIIAYNQKFKTPLSMLRPNNVFIQINKTFDRINQLQANQNDCNNIISKI